MKTLSFEGTKSLPDLFNNESKIFFKFLKEKNIFFIFPCKKGWDLAEWLERLTANATVLGSIPASYDTVESEGR